MSVIDFNNGSEDSAGSEDSDSNSDSSSDFDESQLKKLEEDLMTPKSGHLYSKFGSTEGGMEVDLSGVNVAGEGKVRGGTLFEALFAGSKEDVGEKGGEGGAPSEIQNAMMFQESENLDNTRRTSNNSAPTSPLPIRTTTPTSPMNVPPPSKHMRTAFTEVSVLGRAKRVPKEAKRPSTEGREATKNRGIKIPLQVLGILSLTSTKNT